MKVTVTVTAAAETDVASTSAAAATAVSTASSAAIGNFGSCSVPQIEFAVGFDNRKETSFQPVDKSMFTYLLYYSSLTLFVSLLQPWLCSEH